MKKLQAAKRSEIEKLIGMNGVGQLHEDSGVESNSRSTTPTSSDSLSPVPFADVQVLNLINFNKFNM